MCIFSPERRWRAAAAPLIAAAISWIVSGSIHLGVRPGASPGLSLTARVIVICAAVAIGLGISGLIMRTRLMVTSAGLTDHRIFRVIHVPWGEITGFEINRPSGLWGGFCVVAVCRGGTTVDLMATRAYSRIPSARHIDELYRISWTLEHAAGLDHGLDRS
ncbi:MAG TPA: PH domain-containing protein [Streptosporangiaceae bacterium]|nr:PH domain-containing protein [Streptosporangiaceae bacterium]